MGRGADDGETEQAIYPLSLRLAGRRVVVVGGGAVAVRRVAGLRAAGADVSVVAPRLSPILADLAERGLISARTGGYEPQDLDGAWLAFACTDQPEVNAAVAADAEGRRVWCVRADDGAASPAWVPAVGRVADAVVAVNAARNPRRAAALRDRCVEALDAAEAAGSVRAAANGGAARAAGATGTDSTAGTAAAAEANGAAVPSGRLADVGREHPRRGLVSIVGGGPGDPGLITVAGWERLRDADVVLTDRLAPLALLDRLASDVEVIDVAKVPGGPATRQEQINRTLIDRARTGFHVVRLKGGDPFVFGRGHEEVEACRAAGVTVEVVPGVTSAISVPAAAGIPVTHRGLSQGFCVVAGHASPDDPRSSVDWPALARSGLTLVLLMAIERLGDTAKALMAAGLDAATPSACVADGWTSRQRVVAAPLRDIASTVTDEGLANPAVIVIGDVARFSAQR